MTFPLVVKGDTLAVAFHLKNPDGGTVDESSTWARVSGGPGILGKWKSTKVKSASFGLELTANGADGMTTKYPETGDSCAAKFDGKDYPLTGPRAPSNATYSFRMNGPSSFEMTQKMDGTAVYVDKFTVSADGKTLTDNGTPVSAKEPAKVVYDRQ